MNLPTSPVRPTGVTILAILAAIGGIIALGFGLCATILGGVAGGLIAASGAVGTGALIGLGAILAVLFTVATGVLDLAFAYGAWFLKPWGWILGVAAGGIGVVNQLIHLLNGDGFFGVLIGLLISGGILYYLFTPEVKHAFGRQ